MDTVLFVKVFSGLFAIVNPLLGLTVFLSFTQDAKFIKKVEMAFFASLTIFAILAVSTYCGPEILRFFGLQISSFEIFGGIVVGLIALSMLNGRPGFASDIKSEGHTNPAIIPLAFPIMVGPGAISKMITYSVLSNKPYDSVTLYAAIGSIAVMTFLIFVSGNVFNKVLGKTGISTVTKILALILGAMAVELIVSGIKDAFLNH